MKLVKQGILMSTLGTPTFIEIVNSSLDIGVSYVQLGAITLQLWSGTLPNTTGNGTTLRVPLGVTIPNYYDITVNYGSGSTGQKIRFIDSTLTTYCQDANVGSGLSMTFYGVYVDNTNYCVISAEDGICI
jgi:hypothetical protein